jgi:hypothetical protein
MNQEAEMTKLEKGQESGQPKKRYLWFGYGSYGWQPTQQIGGGLIRNPDMLEKKGGRFSVTYFGYIVMAVVLLTLFVMLVAWAVSLFV